MSADYGPPYGETPGPGPAAVTQEEKNWALVSHIGTLVAAYIALGFLAPLLVMLIKGESPFIRRHAVESLNFQISVLIYAIVGAVVSVLLVLVTFGILAFVIIPVAVILAVAVLALIIIATVKAANGEDYRYPLTLRFVK